MSDIDFQNGFQAGLMLHGLKSSIAIEGHSGTSVSVALTRNKLIELDLRNRTYISSGGVAPENAFDGSETSYWHTTTLREDYIGVDFGAEPLSNLSIVEVNHYGISWAYIEGSNNGATWEILSKDQHGYNNIIVNAKTVHYLSLKARSPYRFIRMRIVTAYAMANYVDVFSMKMWVERV